nr:reverse transcriptase domain-containing protein [Tanacetum cinerariifolium]
RYSRNKPVVAKVSTNTSTSGISPDVAELKDMAKALLLDKKSQNQAPATVRAVEESCDMVKALLLDKKSQNQAPATVRAVEESCANDAVMRNMQTQGQNMQNQLTNLADLLTKFMNSNSASTSSSGTLPSNTIVNPRSDLKAITTQSDVQPPVVPTESLILNSEPVNSPIIEPVASPISAPKPNPKSSIPYPSRRNDERNREKANNKIKKFYQIFQDMNFDADPRVPLILGRSFLKSGRSLIDVFEGKLTLRVGKEAITFNLDQTSRYLANYNDNLINRIDVIEMACEEYSQEVLGFFDVIASGNPTPYYDPIVSTTSSTLTPFENSDFFLEEVDAFLALEDYPTSPKVDQTYFDSEGNILLLEAFLNDDPSLALPNQGNYLSEDLPPHLEYAFLEGDDKLLAIIVKDLSMEEKTTLITILKSHKRAIAWKLFDIKGIDPEFCTHKILMKEDFEPSVQLQRRVNPKIHDVIKQEVLKLLDAGLIYPISDSPWVSPVQRVSKKDGFTVVEIKENELIPTRLSRVGVSASTIRLAGNQYYCFLDGFSGYFQIPIDLKDLEKTTFTCPYGTFAYRRMPFGLCNAPGTFQRCMVAIFHDRIEKTMEVFMDDFLVFGNSFQICLYHLEKMLKRCEDTNLCLNWEKSHFMVKE